MQRLLLRLGLRADAPPEAASTSPPPPMLASELLPGLTFDAGLGWYATNVRWAGAELQVTVSGENAAEFASALETAHQLWRARDRWLGEAQGRAITDLLELKNGEWLGEGETAFTPETFVARMTLEGVGAWPDGTFTFYFLDGDLFWGHTILVHGSLMNGMECADIAG